MAAMLTGQVQDYDTDAPIVNARVSLLEKGGATVAQADTNSDGRYTIYHDAVNDVYSRVYFQADGYISEEMPIAAAENQSVILRKGNVLNTVTYVVKNYKSYIIAIAVIVLLIILYVVIAKNYKK